MPKASVGAFYNEHLGEALCRAGPRIEHLALADPIRPQDPWFARAAADRTLLLHDFLAQLSDRPTEAALHRAGELSRWTRTPWAAEHFQCLRTEDGSHSIDYVFPPLYTEALLGRYVCHAQALRQATGVPLALENIPRFVRLDLPQMSEASFIRRFLEATGAYLILDVAHAVLSARELGVDPEAFVASLPLDRVIEIHAAGLVEDGDLGESWISPRPPTGPILELCAFAARRAPALRAVTFDAFSVELTADALSAAVDSLRDQLDLPAPGTPVRLPPMKDGPRAPQAPTLEATGPCPDRIAQDALLRSLTDGPLRRRLWSGAAVELAAPHRDALLASDRGRLERFALFAARHYYRERAVHFFKYSRALAPLLGRSPEEALLDPAFAEIVAHAPIGHPEANRAVAELLVRHLAGVEEAPRWHADLLTYQAAFLEAEARRIPPAPPQGPALRPGSQLLRLAHNLPSLLPELLRGQAPPADPSDCWLLVAPLPAGGVRASTLPPTLAAFAQALDGRMSAVDAGQRSGLTSEAATRALGTMTRAGLLADQCLAEG